MTTPHDDLRAKALAVQEDACSYECYVRNAFRRAANPATVLALLDENMALRKDVERYRFLRDDVKSAMKAAALVAGCGKSMDNAIDRARGAT